MLNRIPIRFRRSGRNSGEPDDTKLGNLLSVKDGWVRVRTPSGKEGFISEGDLPSNSTLASVHGQWPDQWRPRNDAASRGEASRTTRRSVYAEEQKLGHRRRRKQMIDWDSRSPTMTWSTFGQAGHVGPEELFLPLMPGQLIRSIVSTSVKITLRSLPSHETLTFSVNFASLTAGSLAAAVAVVLAFVPFTTWADARPQAWTWGRAGSGIVQVGKASSHQRSKTGEMLDWSVGGRAGDQSLEDLSRQEPQQICDARRPNRWSPRPLAGEPQALFTARCSILTT